MKRKILIAFIACALIFAMSACGGSDEASDSEATEVTEAAQEKSSSDMSEETEQVDLGVVPEGCTLVPAEQYKAACDMILNQEWPADPVTMDQLVEAFGTEGVYYENCDREEYGTTFKTYAWFSDEDWGNTKVAIAITFQVDAETSDLIYFSHVYQGDDW